MAKKFEYETILIKGYQNGIFAEFPFDSVTEFGSRKAVWAKVSFDGKPYSMSLIPNGKGGHWLHVKKDIRSVIGKEEGDMVKITLEKDESPKEIPVPDYLQWLLDDDPVMTKYFNKLPYSAKKFWLGFIEEPKNDDTKVTRINRLFEVLRENYAGKAG
ncbi:MAG: YdeI/OmpD-associated family protein [Bacteroidota bacterium]